MRKADVTSIARHIRVVLKNGGSPPHAQGVQHFFKEIIQSHGWYTRELRKEAVRFRRSIVKERGLEFLLQVADSLFAGEVLEEKVFAVCLLQNFTDGFGDREFRLFESWIDRISSWADHDALVHYLIAPMVAAKPLRVKSIFRWAKSADRWHRRAACVALIQGTRQKSFLPETKWLCDRLLSDSDDMVQKGLGWLLRETAKANPHEAVPYLMKIRQRAPRLVLRTGCETLPAGVRKRILA